MDNLGILKSARSAFKWALEQGRKCINGQVQKPENSGRSLTGISRKPLCKPDAEIITFTYAGEISEEFAQQVNRVLGVRGSNISFSMRGNTLTTIERSNRRDEIFGGLERIERAATHGVGVVVLDEINSIETVTTNTPDLHQESPELRLCFPSQNQRDAFYIAMHKMFGNSEVYNMKTDVNRIKHTSELHVSGEDAQQLYLFLADAKSLYTEMLPPAHRGSSTPFDSPLHNLREQILEFNRIGEPSPRAASGIINGVCRLAA